ncbi:SLC13 family permease [Cereibacter azotoformans]|uniref:Di/tricarboxylate transporter n=2 Tax=Cereibacter TaxID=1653176 RepID=A0A2T5JXG4_9RHOB|nr:SLC13 family permease [Cereibacter azotoformans]MBO4169584.1 SLC13 family permease [Cereibacter azotoformans]PTR14861.1 di/tricarboxylate transporter [Cereibacter azotoformans]UIJ31084.1 SLC13 family permease [Cereibacter azotoformans]ULB08883.1 SLC13 family permease [Cereibacter azotoformans]
MFGLELSEPMQAWTALAILAGMLVLFVREIYPVEVTAIAGGALMLAVGILPQDDLLKVLSNPAPWTITALFIIVGSLVRTGTLDAVTQLAIRHAADRPLRTLGLLSVVIIGMSAFMNNTPIVVVMIPVFMQIARQMKISPSKVMIPLSYLSIFGGTVTLIGTSTNLLVDGVARGSGLEPFSIFEITPLGIAMALIGLCYLWFFAPRLLPDRDSMGMLLSDRTRMKFFTEVAVPEDSALIGRKVEEVDIFKRESLRVIDVLRGDASLRRNLGEAVLEAGDRVVLRTPMSEVLSLQSNKELRLVDKLSSVQTQVVEVLITPGCFMVGRSLGAMRLRRRYGVYVLAAHRRNQNIGRQLDDLVVQVGDTLLLEGAQQDIERLASEMQVVDIAQPSDRAYRRSRAPVVMAVLAAVVLLSALNVAPIAVLAMIGVAVVLVTRCIDADEAFGYIEGRLLALIFGMLAVGAGLEHSGAVGMIVGAVAPLMQGLPPFLLVFVVYALTSLLTELVSNNAVAVILTPIVIGLAASLGVDPRPFVVAVMFGASASFATPIGYQTNTLVYGPGGYRFTDFLRIGLPLNILMMVAMSLLIPLFFPF